MDDLAWAVSGRTDSIARVEPIGAIDVARYRVGHTGPGELGLDEVIEPTDALRFEVPHHEHCASQAFRPREREHLAL